MKTETDRSLDNTVRPVLEKGEGLLWAGRPDPWRTALVKIGQIVLGATFLLLLLLAYLSGLSANISSVGADASAFLLRPAVLAAGSFFLLSGLFLPVVSFFVARCTVYAVTSRRILSITRGKTIRTVRYEDLQIPLLEVRGNARGDILFLRRVRTDRTEQRPQIARFYGIEAAENVYRLLLGQMLGSAHGRTVSGGAEHYLELLLLGKGSPTGTIARK